MIDPAILVTYIAIVVGFVFLPGPATVLTVTRAISSGTRVGIATGTGIAVGDLIHMVLAAIGTSAIIAASATLFTTVKYVGADYLIFIGIATILSKAPTNLDDGGFPITAHKEL